MIVVRRAIVSMVAAALVACGSDAPRPKPPEVSNTPAPAPAPATAGELAPLAGPIRIGTVMPMTGSAAAFGQSTLAGVQQAVAERNERGGVRGATIEIVSLDDAGKLVNVAPAVTRLIVEDHAVAIVGDVASGATIAGAAVAQEHGIPMITPAATNVRATQVGDKIFRACFTDEVQGRAMARFARQQLHVYDVAILSDPKSAYSVELAESFDLELALQGGSTVLDEQFAS
jgi:branched-chain amino acid transport system substrate-binding protein